MEPTVAPEQEKLALELKFLVALVSPDKESAVLQALNKLYPFTLYPLRRMPPLELFQFEPDEVVSTDLRHDLEDYSFVIVMGKLRVQKGVFTYDQLKLVDQTVREKVIYNFADGFTVLKAVRRTTLLKIHNIWFKMARDDARRLEKEYVKRKLIGIPFFGKLSFQEFDRVASLIMIERIGPGEELVTEGRIPSSMYILAQGEMALVKRLQFSKEAHVWQEVKVELQKKDNLCEQLYNYLVRDPSPNTPQFSVEVQIKLLGQGAMLCGKETLNQTALPYTIVSKLKSKLLRLKYVDMYALSESRLAEVRGWPTIEIDTGALRKSYYCQAKWKEYKEFLRGENELAQLHGLSLDDFLRKDVKLSGRRYQFVAWKAGAEVVESPSAQMQRMQAMSQ